MMTHSRADSPIFPGRRILSGQTLSSDKNPDHQRHHADDGHAAKEMAMPIPSPRPVFTSCQ